MFEGCKNKNQRMHSPLSKIALLCMVLWHLKHIKLVERGHKENHVETLFKNV